MKKNILIKSFALLVVVCMAFAFTAPKNGKGGSLNKETLKAGDSYRLNINNINMPMNRQGVMADVNIGGRSGAELDNKIFLFSGGFFMSGYTNGQLWANAVASASRIQDYNQGTYASGKNDAKAQIYVVRQKDGDFAQSWRDWKDAVSLGAAFYDGDNDGVYNPEDKNGNGRWDTDEDRPDLIGDETVWCVYSDNVDPALRANGWQDNEPQGIEIRQTAFAFASKGVTGNIIYLRYNIVNTGRVADVIDSVYFGVWADPDLGDPYDDLVGCDTTLNSGFVYNDGPDNIFGNDPPSFLIDFFQGPQSFIPGETFIDANNNGIYDEGETALDTAFNVQGKVRGIEKVIGAKNLGLSSFVHYQQSDPTLGDPANKVEARNYMLGKAKLGQTLDPCTWTLGSVVGGVNCAQVNNQFWYSGDPVAKKGWLNSTPADQRQMSNTGPFKLVKDVPVTIVVAYVVGRGTDALSSVTTVKKNDVIAQKIFDANFPSLPPPPPIPYSVKTGDGFIDLDIQTSKMMKYNGVDTITDVNRFVEGLYVTAYRSNTTADVINGQTNSAIVARYDRKDSINNIYYTLGNGGVDVRMPEGPPENKLDTALYTDPNTGRIKLRIETDPFTGGPLIKGHEYYFTITQFTVNKNGVVNRTTNTYGPAGDYIDLNGSSVEEFTDLEPLDARYAASTKLITVTMGSDIYSPATGGQDAKKLSSGGADGLVKYVVVDNSKLTGDTYKVNFLSDTNPLDGTYLPSWSLINTRTNDTLIRNSRVFDIDTTIYAGQSYEGFIPKIAPIVPVVASNADLVYLKGATPLKEADRWYNKITLGNRGVYYVGKDIPQGKAYPDISLTNQSSVISADKVRKVEIRFGTYGKAYRYLNGFKGSVVAARNSYVYGAGITAADTSGGKSTGLGKLGEGFVPVPFTAWVVDSANNEQRQLACGFIERRASYKGYPDGEWDPKDTVANTLEVIMVFDADYDSTGSQIQYTGNSSGWANPVAGYDLVSAGATPEQVKTAKSPYFNTMYLVALDRKPGKGWSSDEKLVIPVIAYPYTSKDSYQFSTKKGGELTETEKKSLWEKVNVFPNPLFGYNPQTSYNSNGNPDEPFVTFSNLPEQVTITIFTLSGTKIRTLGTNDKSTPTAPFIRWNLHNESDLRVASGMYLAIVSSPVYGEKVLKFAIVMPQKQIQNY